VAGKSATQSVFQAAPKSLISDHVAGALEKAITTGKLRPGAKLLLRDLASEFNISMIPVREALNRLVARGLVQRDPNRGMFVVQLSVEELELILEVRIRLEGLVARLACTRAIPDELKALQKIVVSMAKALERKDWLQYAETDSRFHQKLWTCVRNPFLGRCLNSIMLPWFGYQMASGVLSIESEYETIPALHKQIVDAIESGDAERAEESITILSSCMRTFLATKKSATSPSVENGRASDTV
jgi:DNA-binding GntR family transcriptional regulator